MPDEPTLEPGRGQGVAGVVSGVGVAADATTAPLGGGDVGAGAGATLQSVGGWVPSDLKAGSQLGDAIELAECIGAGAMGEVWRARQLSTQRDVAVKFLRPDLLGSEELRRRFATEVRLAASLEHRGIARVYDSGLHRGTYYYVMELVDGVPLAAHCAGLGAREKVGLMSEVCEAVGHAHSRGVIHHDLKPANVLVSRRGGEAKVTDFGLARSSAQSVGGDCGVGTGAYGTPGYMPPEQARGEAAGTQADVFALAATLLMLLTGRTPYPVDGGREAVIARAARGPVPVVEPLGGDGDLAAVLRKALDPDPAVRHDTAGLLADDLRAVLGSLPVSARRATLGYVARKFVNRRPGVTAVIALSVAALGSGAGVYVVSLADERDRTEEARSRAEDARRKAEVSVGQALDAVRALLAGMEVPEEELRAVAVRLEAIAESAAATADPAGRVLAGRARLLNAEVAWRLGDRAGAANNLDAVRGELLASPTTPEESRVRALAAARLARAHADSGFPESEVRAIALLDEADAGTAGITAGSTASEQLDRASVLAARAEVFGRLGDAARAGAALRELSSLPAATGVYERARGRSR